MLLLLHVSSAVSAFYSNKSSSERIFFRFLCILSILLCVHGNKVSDAHSDSRDEILFLMWTGALCSNPGSSQRDNKISRQITYNNKADVQQYYLPANLRAI